MGSPRPLWVPRPPRASPNPLGFVPVDSSAPATFLGHRSAASWRGDVCTSHGRVPRVGNPRSSKSFFSLDSALDHSSRRRLLSPSRGTHLFQFLSTLSNPPTSRGAAFVMAERDLARTRGLRRRPNTVRPREERMTATDPIERTKAHAAQMYPSADVRTKNHRGRPVVLVRSWPRGRLLAFVA